MKAPDPTAKNLCVAHRFKPGQSGNPKGRPRGGRNRLSDDFVQALYDDFRVHGRGAIVAVREKDPSTYMKVIAKLLPKEVAVSRPLEFLSDDELIDAIAIIQSTIVRNVVGENGAPVVDDAVSEEMRANRANSG